EGEERRDGRPAHRHGNRPQRSGEPREAGAGNAGGENDRAARPPRSDRPFRSRPEGDAQRGPRPERVQVHQDRRREKQADPDSPFAALAALKAKLESEKKGN
ncbi:MAG: hypothetical protein AB1592_17620, partial [Pseudomonadota bacterium]